MMTNMVGTPKMAVREINPSQAGIPAIVIPPETSSVRPRKPCSPARVTMNAGMPSLSIASPFTTPISSPSPRAPRIASGIGMPPASIIANTTPTSPATAPTERSIPAVMMANSSP